MSTTIEIDNQITVGSLAEKLNIPVTKLITELMKNGVMATVNESIDFDTAQIIVSELDLDIELNKRTIAPSEVRTRPKGSKSATTRPPVVAVMGHVDHGKTSLLDAIRGASVVKGEAGGITQHISAYQIIHDKREITFLDTPGHEAFAALREHGAQLTDVVVIVVAADDGIKPQTIEAIRFARKAGVKIIVAINKIDKQDSDINKIKQQLSEQDLLIEEWGGDIVVVPVSAKTKEGVTKLLDMILLIADVEDLKADFDVPASGLIIEAHTQQGRGSVAVALIEQGKLSPGQYIVAGGSYAKVRNLETTSGNAVKSAGPSSPVVITGFKSLPEFGDTFTTVKDEKSARLLANSQATQSINNKMDINSNELIRMINRSNKLSEYKIVIKADVQGSLTTVIDSLRALDNEEVAVRIVGSGIGAINENDIHMASTSNATIYGFNITMPSGIKQLASRDKVQIILFKVIYELLDDVKENLEKLLSPEILETDMGRLVVKGIFNTTKTEVICGGEVTKGKLTVPALIRVIRDKESIAEVEATLLKRGPQETKEVIEGEMCGVSLTTNTKLELHEGDHLEFFTRKSVARSL